MAQTIQDKVGDWQKDAKNDPTDVKVVQTLLTQVAAKLGNPQLKPRGINGEISRPPNQSSTVKAILEFQKQVMLMTAPDGRVDPGGRTLAGLNALLESSGFEKLSDVKTALRKKVHSFVAMFGKVAITSGKRTVRKQAELMAPMSDKDLNMYGSSTFYIVQIKALPKPQRTVAEVEKILKDAQQKGSRISHHLAGSAADISAKGAFNWVQANKAARKAGLTVKEERWRNCFHVQL